MKTWLLALCACRAPAAHEPTTPPPPPPKVVDAGTPFDQDLPRLATRSLAMYTALAGAFAKAGTDCAAATTALGALEKEYADAIAANAKVLRDGRAKELREALAPHQGDFDAQAKAIAGAPTLAACERDKPFADAFDRLAGPPP
jgi:hypothetical protein